MPPSYTTTKNHNYPIWYKVTSLLGNKVTGLLIFTEIYHHHYRSSLTTYLTWYYFCCQFYPHSLTHFIMQDYKKNNICAQLSLIRISLIGHGNYWNYLPKSKVFLINLLYGSYEIFFNKKKTAWSIIYGFK